MIGLYIAEYDIDNTVIVKTEPYKGNIHDYLFVVCGLTWLCNGTHSGPTDEILKKASTDHLTSRFGNSLWFARSPDLNILNFLILQYFKVMGLCVQALVILKKNIRGEMRKLDHVKSYNQQTEPNFFLSRVKLLS